ncbi:MAG: hypothetical protein OEM97_11010, partial [Acidimicrobiia bacterium]|nr:hypothetical protein [Acidimicrobiia bacterium]
CMTHCIPTGTLSTVLSTELARALQVAGLVWEPAVHDRFVIPGRDLDGQIFALNDLSTEIHEFGTTRAITFNGAVEWSLDWILSEDVVWVPDEGQLRDALGETFLSLDRCSDGYTCRFRLEGAEVTCTAAGAAEAYGHALLATMEAARDRRSA